MTPRRTGLICSTGGHLAQLMRLRPWWSRLDRFWVTFDKPDSRELLAGERVYWASGPTNRDLGKAWVNLLLARTILSTERPDLLVSNGAGLAVPFFVVGARRGTALVWIEVPNRVDGPSLTGRLLAPLCDATVATRGEQRAFLPHATLLTGGVP